MNGMAMLLDSGKFLWRQECIGTACVLKGNVTASHRIQNFEKRLVTFGDTALNVHIFFRKLKAVIFEKMLSFQLESHRNVYFQIFTGRWEIRISRENSNVLHS